MSRRIIEKFIYIAFAAAGLITTIAITVSDFVFGYDTTFIKYGGIIACENLFRKGETSGCIRCRKGGGVFRPLHSNVYNAAYRAVDGGGCVLRVYDSR